MSPQRRQTRASASSNSKVTSCNRQDSENVVPRTRSGLSRSNPASPSKLSKPIKGSPSKRKSQIAKNASPSRNNLLKPSSPKRGSVKVADKSSIESPVRGKTSPLKSAPQSSESATKKRACKPVPISASLRASPRRAALKTPTTPISPRSIPKHQNVRNETSVIKSPSTPSKEALKVSPSRAASSKANFSLKQSPKSSPTTQTRSSRKRLLPSPTRSPQSPKNRRLRGNILTPVQIKEEPDEDDCLILNEINCDGENLSRFCGVSNQENPGSQKSIAALPSDPELSGRFLRRKWFSLKAKGGFTCLRSAILSPEEIAQEIIQHTNVETQQNQDSNFFTTKLMVRLSSRLPPARARPSCEELVDLINSKQTGPKLEPQTEQKGEGTAIRVKLERRSFSDTISHLNTKPVKTIDKFAPSSNLDLKPEIRALKEEKHLSKKQEREIALRQLKDLSAPEEENPLKSTGGASRPSEDINKRLNKRRWFSLKSRGSFTCLRSAILSPEELTEEFLKRTKVDPNKCLTYNTVMQHYSRVGSSSSQLSPEELLMGSSRPRLTHEELAAFINSKELRKNYESLVEPRDEIPVNMNDLRKKERELALRALQQLNVMRSW